VPVTDLDRLRDELGVPAAFPPEVTAAVPAAIAAGRAGDADRSDRRDLELVTLDPPGARDLDQAFAIERRGESWRVWYAIADVAAFVTDGSPIDVEARARGVTLYLPDGRAPLHPEALSEGAASLLPGEDRPALLWQLDVDGGGVLLAGRVRRAVVRSRAQLDYPSAQADLDGADPPAALALLRDLGLVLQAGEQARGGVSLPLPEQVVEPVPGEPGRSRLAWRTPLPVERWNAQLSLLAGRAGANLVLEAGTGLLRTLPPFDERAVDGLRRRAEALGVRWPDGPVATAYPAFVRSLDPATPIGAALLQQSARALRGAGYLAFAGERPVAPDSMHAAVAAPYAHVTAPLRRLGDRFAAEAALAASAGVDPPAWLVEALPLVPDLMAAARQREGAVTRAVLDLTEAVVLATRVGDVLDAVVVGEEQVQVLDPPVVAKLEGAPPLGTEVRVEVKSADPASRTIVLGVAVRQ
jgi:exoribonuclease R